MSDSDGMLTARPPRPASGSGLLLLLGVAVLIAPTGCAQRRQARLGTATSPGTSLSRTEPGLRVRAPFVDVQVADGDAAGVDAQAKEPADAKAPWRLSSRVGIFRSPSLGRSLGEGTPLN